MEFSKLLFPLLLAIVHVASCFAPLTATASKYSLLQVSYPSERATNLSRRGVHPLTVRASPASDRADNLGPAERVQRSLDRDAGKGREEMVRFTVAKLIELRRRGLKYDGTPLSAEDKAADAAKLMEKMMREGENFFGS